MPFERISSTGRLIIFMGTSLAFVTNAPMPGSAHAEGPYRKVFAFCCTHPRASSPMIKEFWLHVARQLRSRCFAVELCHGSSTFRKLHHGLFQAPQFLRHDTLGSDLAHDRLQLFPNRVLLRPSRDLRGIEVLGVHLRLKNPAPRRAPTAWRTSGCSPR